MSRGWGPWTEVKLDALGNYLQAFTVASARAKRTLYLDLMAGSISNRSRDTGREIAGSAERALSVVPSFSRAVLCELQPKTAATLKSELQQRHPGRDLQLKGDCNDQIPRYLDRIGRDPKWRWAPTFAFVDQYSAEIEWDTLKALAEFRNGDRKVELWLYFGDSFLPRGLASDSDAPHEEYAQRVDKMYGDASTWRQIYAGRKAGVLTSSEAKAELVNLMRWRLQTVLGYKTTLPLSIVRDNGSPLYTMIFATDHDVGEKIMRSVLSGAERDLETMIARTKARKRVERSEIVGQGGLFAVDDSMLAVPTSSKGKLMLDPPRPPWTYPGT